MRFKNKFVLIIGGNSGIGLAAAKQFVAEGARVCITGRDEKTLERTRTEIGNDTVALRADVSDLAATDSVMARVKQEFGRLDVLFVNAGIGNFVAVEQTTEAQYDHMMGINLKGPYFAVQKALPLMGSGASIVLTSSIGHMKGIAGNSVYAAAKAGLRALARNFGAELVGRGIRVNCFSPGPIDTPLFYRSGISEQELEATRTMITNLVPMKRMGTPEEAARAVLFLASDDASFITGIDLFVDGGVVSF